MYPESWRQTTSRETRPGGGGGLTKRRRPFCWQLQYCLQFTASPQVILLFSVPEISIRTIQLLRFCGHTLLRKQFIWHNLCSNRKWLLRDFIVNYFVNIIAVKFLNIFVKLATTIPSLPPNPPPPMKSRPRRSPVTARRYHGSGWSHATRYR
jgi:hypothetical protein